MTTRAFHSLSAPRYSHIWEVEGAVDASVGAKRVLHEVKTATMERSGMFIVSTAPAVSGLAARASVDAAICLYADGLRISRLSRAGTEL